MVIIFCNITVLLYYWSNKCCLGDTCLRNIIKVLFLYCTKQRSGLNECLNAVFYIYFFLFLWLWFSVNFSIHYVSHFKENAQGVCVCVCVWGGGGGWIDMWYHVVTPVCILLLKKVLFLYFLPTFLLLLFINGVKATTKN